MEPYTPIKIETVTFDPEVYVGSDLLEGRTGLKPRFWENRRLTGDGPPFIRISGRCVRYRWGDVVAWMEARKRTSTADKEEKTRAPRNSVRKASAIESKEWEF